MVGTIWISSRGRGTQKQRTYCTNDGSYGEMREKRGPSSPSIERWGVDLKTPMQIRVPPTTDDSTRHVNTY
jgi:hypothetical protein